MARKIGRITADVGKYQGQDGQEKTRWHTCGTIFENNGKLSVKMDSFPVGPDWSGWLRIFLEDGLSVSVQGQAQQRQGNQTWQGQHPRQQQGPSEYQQQADKTQDDFF